MSPTLAASTAGYDPILNIHEASAYTGRHPQTLRKAVRERALSCCRLGALGKLRFRLSHLNAWLRRQECPASRVREV